MSVYINWLKVSDIKLSVANRGEEMGDGNSVDSPAAIVIDEGDEPIIIEGRRESLANMTADLLRKLQRYRSADLETVVKRVKRIDADEDGSTDDLLESLKEALDVALTILNRGDLRG